MRKRRRAMSEFYEDMALTRVMLFLGFPVVFLFFGIYRALTAW